jgi:cytochrome c oxidase accessory protein FixG
MNDKQGNQRDEPPAQPLIFHPPASQAGASGDASAGQDGNTLEQSLYEIRRKIYPRAVSGWFASWRLALIIVTQVAFYGTAWLQWNDRQAVLFDLAARKFYIFGVVFWPQDFIYLTALLIVSALSLFLFTALAGRLWCGYACPQTVYTEIFMWIERKVEGDRAARMRLDGEAASAGKYGKKALKHFLWIALALWTGFTFVGYFTPIRDLSSEVAALALGPWETFWLLFYSFATYGNAGWMREQVCKYMCPYARFQSAMFDQDTLIVTYDKARGETRGSRSKSIAHDELAARGLGDCVDCGICVQVCPTGIDIRNGLQYECIGCAACIDSCNQVMKKLNYPPGLIRYSTENALQHGWSFGRIFARVLRPRVLIYSGILAAVVIFASVSLFQRIPLKVDVIRDRAVLAREAEDGRMENIYRLQVMNTSEAPMRITISVEGGEHLQHLEVTSGGQVLELAPVTSRLLPVRVSATPSSGKARTERIEFIVTAQEGSGQPGDPNRGAEYIVHEKSSFFVPARVDDDDHEEKRDGHR